MGNFNIDNESVKILKKVSPMESRPISPYLVDWTILTLGQWDSNNISSLEKKITVNQWQAHLLSLKVFQRIKGGFPSGSFLIVFSKDPWSLVVWRKRSNLGRKNRKELENITGAFWSSYSGKQILWLEVQQKISLWMFKPSFDCMFSTYRWLFFNKVSTFPVGSL